MDRTDTIVALDPGGTTGLTIYTPVRCNCKGFTYHSLNCAYRPGGSEWDPKFDDERWQHAQLGPTEHHVQLFDLLASIHPTVIVCERFTYQQRDKVVLVPVEYIGVAKLYAAQHQIPLRLQTPSQAKNLWTDSKLQRLGLWSSGMRHANDATRHMLYYFTVTLKDLTWVKRLGPN